MKALKQDHNDLQEEQILQMATINGAKALGFEKEYGSIERGKNADLLSLSLSFLQEISDPYGAVVNLTEKSLIKRISSL